MIRIFLAFGLAVLSLTFVAAARCSTDSEPIILSKPTADLSRVGECERDLGIVQLRIVFHKSGKVTEAEVIMSSGCEFF